MIHLEAWQTGHSPKVSIQGLSSSDDPIFDGWLVALVRHHQPHQGGNQDYHWAPKRPHSDCWFSARIRIKIPEQTIQTTGCPKKSVFLEIFSMYEQLAAL